jgi:hypothetical protein
MTTTHPVHVSAQLDPNLSRWKWLVKWLLVLPHYFVLAFLWLAFLVLSVVAFFSILFTDRYPKGIFDFNVGVLRWSWRVTYYAYGALGTDRYPPFSLDDRPDYPAHLDVDYPEHLSRGLVLVKWWLLAIPHYLIVGLFLGGGGYLVTSAASDLDPRVVGGGLIGLLVLVAAVILLFTGRYPQPIYNLVLGLNRWVLRVAGYVSLMTDVYPPFRLDQGGDDPSGGGLSLMDSPGPLPQPGPGGPTPVAPPSNSSGSGSSWTAGRVVALVAGSVILLGSLGMGAGGGALAVAGTTMRDDQGFLMSGAESFRTDGYAITSERVDLETDAPAPFLPDTILGDAKLTVSATGDTSVFVGIGDSSDVAEYLRGVEHATVVDFAKGDPVYRISGGGAPTAGPTDTDIWVAHSVGTGTHSLTWPIEAGNWSIVVMNADGSRQVSVDVAAGASVPALGWVVGTLLVLAGIGLLTATVLLVVGMRDPRQPQPGPATASTTAGERDR